MAEFCEVASSIIYPLEHPIATMGAYKKGVGWNEHTPRVFVRETVRV
jgi:hypothetical protein